MQFERKSIYIPKPLIAWVNAQAKKKKLNFSSMIASIIKDAKGVPTLKIIAKAKKK